MMHRDVIAAIATAPGRGGIGVVRVSGNALQAYAAPLIPRTLTPRHAAYTPFLDAAGQAIDEGLVLFFPAPHSYTGEDVLELHGHGGPMVQQQLLQRCLELGARLARPGEFTERAFLNGRMDLAQAEGVADLIEASTALAARAALHSLQGQFSQLIQSLINDLVRLRTLLEATLDFPEEEVEFLTAGRAEQQLAAIREQLAATLAATRQGSVLRNGIQVVLVGAPNVGKSSLLNRLAGEDIAIVTATPGTTRDALRQQIDLGGVPVHVIDTAGLRDDSDGGDEVERIGIARSWVEIEQADAVVFLHDLTRRGEPAYETGDDAIAARLQRHEVRDSRARVLHVFNKCDAVAPAAATHEGLALSARTGAGLALLRRALLERAGWHASPEGLYIARTRHVQALNATGGHLDRAQALAARADAALDLLAEELRLAHQCLNEITGAFSADDLLGEIFGRFCIGK